MVKIFTSNDSAEVGVNAGREVMVLAAGTWDGASLDIAIKDGNGTYVTEPNNGTKTADFAVIYTVGLEDGIQLTLSGAGGSTNVVASVKELSK